ISCRVSCVLRPTSMLRHLSLGFFSSIFFFFHDTTPTEIYTLSLHDALPISKTLMTRGLCELQAGQRAEAERSLLQAYELDALAGDRKSTRLNSSHVKISYAVFCLKKKNT